jgi:transmembrane sensor
MSEKDPARDAILEQAARWYLANRAGEHSPADKAAFLTWVKRSPAHIEEYFAVASAADLLAAEARAATDSLRELDADSAAVADNIIPFGSDVPFATQPNAPIRSTKLRLRLVAACVAFFTLGVLAYASHEMLQFGFGNTYQTVHGQQGSWRLPDNSVLYLNTQSAATVRFDADERIVKLHYGQARFKVEHDAARRFRVMAGDATIIAVGTEFDVYLLADAARVTTIEGNVAVLKQDVPPPATPISSLPDAVSLPRGQQLLVGRNSISKPRAVDIEQAGAWLQRRIVFEDSPLRQVLAEFNRYSSVSLQVADQSLGDLKITGSFSAYDLASFLEFMRRVDGVAVDERPGMIIFRRRLPHTLHPTRSELPARSAGGG